MTDPQRAARVSRIMELQTPDWEDVQAEYAAMKEKHELTEVWLSKCFDYKTPQGFRNATRYKKIITGAVRLWLKTQK